MLKTLTTVRTGLLRTLLEDPDTVWQSLDVLYEEPHVERVWIQLRENRRLCLHRIYPCDKPFYHPHPWPSAVYIVTGQYAMNVGYGDPAGPPPPIATTLELCKGSGYEMLDPKGWHDVNPYVGPSLSLMLTGSPWYKDPSKPKTQNRPLDPAVKAEILEEFRISLKI